MIIQETAELIFKAAWFFLLIAALLAQIFFKGRQKQGGGAFAKFLVIAPYLVVFGWFSARDYLGTYKPNIIFQLSGIFFMFAGISGYIVSILFLRNNWAISAAIKEGHTLVKNGPYRFVRHPMYFFMTLEVLGSGLLVSNFLIILYTPVVGFLYYLRSRKEEVMLAKTLPGYAQYMKESKMLIPGIY